MEIFKIKINVWGLGLVIVIYLYIFLWMYFFECEVLKLLGVLMIIILWLNWIEDFCLYLFVIDDVEVEDLNIFCLRIVFLVVFFFVFVLLSKMIFIFLRLCVGKVGFIKGILK